MADQSLSAVSNTVIWDKRSDVPIHWRRANGSDLKPGLTVNAAGETTPDIDLTAGTPDVCFGVLDRKEDHDIDTAYDDNEWVPVIPIGSGIGVYCLRVGTACGLAVEDGDIIVTLAEAGKVGKATDYGVGYVGRCAAYEAADTSNDTWIKVRI